MATPAHALAVKSLNTSEGRRRFVFKSFSQRVHEIDIRHQSFEKINTEPSHGSSFFLDCLIEWRELNTAEDFISFYEEMMPFVQTLPLVILHKDKIFSELISRLQMKARLSLDPILRLLAALARDLLEEFLPFLPVLADSLVSLLKSGADREPEIIERIFSSWSSIMRSLRNYLVRDIANVLKITVRLRYYPKDYIQKLMAEAMSFLLRNSCMEQLKKGIYKMMLEVVKKPLPVRKSGAGALLCDAMIAISSSRFHSKAYQFLQLLVKESIFSIGNKFPEGPDTILEVVILTFQNLSEKLEANELKQMWKCLYGEISHCLKQEIRDTVLLHLSRLLSLVISTVKFNIRRNVFDHKGMLEHMSLLLEKFILPSGNREGHSSEIIEKVLQLMLNILDSLYSANDFSTIKSCESQWAPIFGLRNSSLLVFIGELLQKDPHIIYVFRVHVLRALNYLIESSQKEVICLLLLFSERLQMNPQSSNFLEEMPAGELSMIHEFTKLSIDKGITAINDIVTKSSAPSQNFVSELALLWGIISCHPYLSGVQANSSLLMQLIDALVQLLNLEEENLAGVSKDTWQSLVGAALSSFNKCHFGKKSVFGDMNKVLRLAKAYKSSSQVLSAVADYLEYVNGPAAQEEDGMKIYCPDHKEENAINAFGTFADNLCHSDKGIRLHTLRILCQYEPLSSDISSKDQQLAEKKIIKTEVSQASTGDDGGNVFQQLLSIETTPLSVSTSRKVTLLISKIEMDLSAGRISEIYVPLVLNGILGIFHNRLSYLWVPASNCLAILISKHIRIVWEKFICYFEQCLTLFQTSFIEPETVNANLSDTPNDLVGLFSSFANPSSDSTPCTTVLSLLIQSLQKIPSLAESHSRQIIPLFLRFLGYNLENLVSVGSFNSHACKGKKWKGILKEWLDLLKLMRNPSSFYQSQFLKEVLQNRLLDEIDAEIQMRILDCLLLWKDDYLLPYNQHLKNLVDSKNLREELATWSLSKESGLIEEDHRANLLPLVLCLLMPKVRRLKTLASRKQASVHHRKAVLGFIAQVDVDELPLFFALLIKPFQFISSGADCTLNLHSIHEFQAANYLKYFTVEHITALSWKKRHGFLHVVEDVLDVFDELHIKPFLDLLMGCVVRVLLSCSENLDIARGNKSYAVEICSSPSSHEKENAATDCTLTSMAVKQFKDLRSLCLKIFSFVLNKYENHDFGCEFWDLFFRSVKPLIEGFKQECSSSEKQSSLFSCFLAMSRSHRLVSLLSREQNLVPDIFSILSVTTASEAVIYSVLKFIENLLSLDCEVDDAATRSVINSNLEMLVCSLHCVFQSGNASDKRKMVTSPGEVEIKIFKLLSRYVRDPLLAKKLVDILLPFLSKRVKDSDVSLEAVQILRDIIPVSGRESTTKILDAISPLLVSVDREMRLHVCDLLEVLSRTDASVLVVARLLRRLNATSAVEMGDLDYDTIVSAYGEMEIGLFYSIPMEHALLILSHFVYDLSSEDLILRHSAYRSFLIFLEFSCEILQWELTDHHETAEIVMAVDKGCWTKPCIQSFINKFLLKHMGDAMSRESSVKKEWIDLLREMVLKVPEVANLNSLKNLCSEDAEKDFFNNIVHLQKYRRAKALSRFRNVISEGNMSKGVINKVFIPLLFNMLFDVQHGKDEHIRTACVQALASISAQMEWKPYFALLIRCFHEMRLNADKQKLLLRLICSILDQFHFSHTSSGKLANVSSGSNLGVETMGLDSAALQKCDNFDEVAQIQTSLHKTLLPKIQKLLNLDSDKVNVNVCLAALKLLKLLPGEIMDMQLPSIIHRVSNFLKSRAESTRDEARSALAECLKELGLEYLQYMVQVLRATLKRGFEQHVLGYTLNFLLSKILSKDLCGKLDYCLEDLLYVVESDIFGDVAEEREVEKIASKMKETKKCKSFETLKLIAQSITFKGNASKLLSTVTKHLQEHLTPKVKAKLESMLNHIAMGIECNPSVDQTHLFTFVYGHIKDGIGEENGQRNNVSAKTVCSGTKFVYSHLITVFALGLLQNRIKNMKWEKNDELLQMTEPFVKLLGSCLSSKYEDILASSIRCLTPLMRLPLECVEAQADKVKVTLLDIAQGSVNPANPLMHSCLKLLTVLLRSTRITLSSDQLHLLIQFPIFVDLAKNPSPVALSLLKAIVNRKLVVPEIYDLTLRVAELMVTSQVESIRKKCSQILLQFLLDYGLSSERLQQHLDFLLKNLRYEHPTGREAVLEILRAIIMKFPQTIVDEQSKAFFLHLVQCLVNDKDKNVRIMTSMVIRLLMGHITQDSLNSILESCLSWYSVDNEQLWSAGAQVLGLLIEVMKNGFRGHVNTVLPVTRRILHSALNYLSERQVDFSDETNFPFWKEAYYSLVMLEKMLLEFHVCLERDLEDIWEMICEFLLYPHIWLRNISSRLVSLYFKAVTEAIRVHPERSLGTFSLMKPTRLFMISVSLYCQLKTELTDDSIKSKKEEKLCNDPAVNLTESLVSSICCLHSLMGKWACMKPSEFWSSLQQHEQGHFLKAFKLLDLSKGRDIFLSVTSVVDDQNDEDHSEDLRYMLVSNLLKKLGKLSLQKEDIQMKIVFNSFRKISSQIIPDDCEHYAFQMLLPLYKVSEGFAGRVIIDDMKQLAQEVSESIRNKIGIDNFVKIYSEISKSLKTKRNKRRREEKQMAVVNPVRNAKRKLRVAAKHRANKKRKIMTLKMQRWM